MGFFLRNSKCYLKSINFFPMTKYSTKIETKGLVLGVYSGDGAEIQLTPTAQAFNKKCQGKLIEHISLGKPLKVGQARVFWGLDDVYQSVSVVGIRKPNSPCNQLEELNEDKESIRIAAGTGCKSLASVGIQDISIEDLGDFESAAEGATLATWTYHGCKSKDKCDPIPKIIPYNIQEPDSFEKGLIKANAQNFARRLMETPANLMTPTIFACNAEELLSLGVTVTKRDKAWIESQKMGAFLSVTRGSIEPPVFLELEYKGPGTEDKKPIVLVGKGVTFDSGGISIKPSANMDHMRADMGGAACVVATIKAAAELKLDVNIRGLIPLCENMPSGHATKPGDVVYAMNGKSICVDNTDAEGRLILADALCYSKCFDPAWVLDIATLTGAMSVALGKGATGVFTNSNALWDKLKEASVETGDRVWRFPLFKHYSDRVTKYTSYDVNNMGKGKGGGSCVAAAFLKEFVPENTDWLHLDIAGVMGPGDDISYLKEGMTGRPTRTLIEFIECVSQTKQ